VCRTRGCGFRRRAGRVSRAGGANLARFLRGRRLAVGTVFEVRVTAPNHIGKVTRFRVRAGRLPSTRSLCLPPGQSTAVRCASA
jgi:hypothetical protein